MTIRHLAQSEVERLLGRLVFEVRAALLSATPDTVHDLRVAVRRFSQSLRVFKEVLPAKPAKKVRREIRTVRDEASQLRDADVMTELMQGLGLPSAHKLFKQLSVHRATEEARLRECLRSLSASDYSANWRAMLRPPETPPVSALTYAHQHLPSIALQYFETGEKLVAKSRTPEELHQFRIETKRFRYTLEMFQQLYGPVYATRLKRVQSIQSILGDVNDANVAHEKLAGVDEQHPLLAVLSQSAIDKEAEFRTLWSTRFAPKAEQNRWVRYLSTGGATKA